jgi:hypothetical protein
MRWAQFERAEPEMASLARREFERQGIAIVGTIRRDGSPRLSHVDPCLLDGELLLGMMWRSRKARDLMRDPRVVIANAVCTNTGDERELSLRGRATAVEDPERRRRYVEAVAARTSWREPHFHLFAVDVEAASLVEYGGGEQRVRVWPGGRETRRTYG